MHRLSFAPAAALSLSVAGQPEGLLLIRLAGVELAAGGTAWLQRELLPKQPLWFQLLGRDSSALECLVLVHKVKRDTSTGSYLQF